MQLCRSKNDNGNCTIVLIFSTMALRGGRQTFTVSKNLGRDMGRNNHYFSVKIQDGTGTGQDN
jgi:hypothetical protein